VPGEGALRAPMMAEPGPTAGAPAQPEGMM
jgi:hypothetical protein